MKVGRNLKKLSTRVIEQRRILTITIIWIIFDKLFLTKILRKLRSLHKLAKNVLSDTRY